MTPTLRRALIAIAAILLTAGSLIAAGTPLTHGRLSDDAVTQLGGR